MPSRLDCDKQISRSNPADPDEPPMARKDDLEDCLGRLSDLRRETDHDAVVGSLKDALLDRRAPLVAKAAELIETMGLDDLQGDMERAFLGLLQEPLKRDKGCVGKTALAKALLELERPSDEVFLAGVRWIQMEPSWGPPVDTAANLRGFCAHGLVRSRQPDAVLHITPLLVDKEPAPRLGAVRALGESGQPAAEALLRLKILTGDEEPEVVGEAFSALMSLSAERSLDFIVPYLDDADPSMSESAALALGGSRHPAVVEPLKSRLETALKDDIQGPLYLALSITRLDSAIDHLVETVADGPIGRARHALSALKIHYFKQDLRDRLRPSIEQRRDSELDKIWRRDFDVD